MTWAGLALLLLLAVDIFMTVFDPHAHGGPVNRLQNRLIWRLLAAGCRRLAAPLRDRILAAAAPLLAVLTPVAWAAVLILAFALIYRDSVDVLRYTEAGAVPPWITAFYFSGTTTSTLGFGDLVPAADWLRLTSTLQAISGFMLMTVSVSYIVSLYEAEHRAAGAALDIAGALGGAEEERGWTTDLDRLEAWAEQEVKRLNLILTSLSRFPILNYFRPRDRRHSLMVQVGRLVRLLGEAEPRIAGDPARYHSLAALGRALDAYLESALVAFVRNQPVPGSEEGGSEQRRRQHRRLMRHLCYDLP